MAVTSNRSVILGFLDTSADPFRVTVSKVKDLTDSTGKTLVNAAMDAMMINQIFIKELAAKQSARQRVITDTDIELS